MRSLAQKYAALVALRTARAAGDDVPPKSVFRRLAAQFPGALWELDRLPLATLEERHHALEAAANGAPLAPWMGWLEAYHALFRGALAVKGRVGPRKELRDGELESLGLAAERAARRTLPRGFVAACVRPPGGRLADAVWSALEAETGEPKEALRLALFPSTRARRPLP